jgi:hypothetical protein
VKRALLLSLALACACNEKTGFLLEVQGPNGQSSIAAGIVSLRVLGTHASYCGREVFEDSSAATYSVAKRDLSRDPLSILVQPDHETDLSQAVTPIVLALGADGGLLGAASFESQRFVFKTVTKFTARVGLYGDAGATYLTGDGCVCAPGLPLIGNGSGQGCDVRIPPSYEALVHTAGCELPAGEVLPLGVCDGQLYPNEAMKRLLPCYASDNGTCRVGTRTCYDQGGYAYNAACAPGNAGYALPTTALCDAFTTCSATSCSDPLVCEKTAKTITHHALTCTLPVAPAAVGDMNPVAQPCDDASDWSTVLGAALTGTACTASIIDGTDVGPFTIGWQMSGTTGPQVSSSQCPPTLIVGQAISPPSALPAQQAFSVTIGDAIYDGTLNVSVGCPGAAGDAARQLSCSGF